MSKYSPNGSKTTEALTKIQVDYVIQEFEEGDGLKVKPDLRMAILCAFMFQCLRISDVLQIKKGDIYYQDGSIKSEINIFEQKTKKARKIFLYDQSESNEKKRGNTYRMLKLYLTYLKGNRRDSVLFYNYRSDPISARGVNERLKRFKSKKNIEQISCHSFRKAGGTHLIIDKGASIEYVRKIMNHRDTQTTMRYLNLKEVEMRDIMLKLIY